MSPLQRTPSGNVPSTHDYDHDGVLVSDVPEDEQPQPRIYEGNLANKAGPGAEAVAPIITRGNSQHDSASTAVTPSPSAAPPTGPPNGRPKLDKYAYGFFDPQMAGFRKIVFKILGGGAMLTIIIMWLALPMYWGSLWLSNVYTNNLGVRIVDYDGGAIGAAVTQGLMARTGQLGYFTSPASDWSNAQSLIDSVLDEKEWAAITINSAATANLLSARQNGLASYNGSSAISVYYSQARNELAVNSYLNPYIQMALGEITARLSAQSAAEYLGANSGNATAITLLAQAPQTVSQGIYFTLNNLRPYNQPVANAITLVGLIYMLIFSFIIAMNGMAAREMIAPFLTTKAYIVYRIVTPLLLYMPIALLFAMVNLPFRIHFDAHYSYAGGFFLWAFSTYLGMCALGFALEFALAVIGPKFIGFFLVCWIIVNVSYVPFSRSRTELTTRTVALPHELQPWIFRYGAGMPFYNLNRVVRTIIFNTKNEIGQNLGILLAWTAVSLITVSMATWLSRRKAVNQHRMAKGEEERVATAGRGEKSGPAQ